MVNKIYKLTFKSKVHIGGGSITDGESYLYADTIFSALCSEALRMYGEDGIKRLVNLVKDGKLLISDGFPFIKDELYIPKPIMKIASNSAKSGSEAQSDKKAFKKLNFIPLGKLDEYLNGVLDAASENEKLKRLGMYDLIQKVSLKTDRDNELFSVGGFTFSSGCGIYIIVSADSEDVQVLINELVGNLSFSGIGGKRSAGYGRFEYSVSDPAETLLSKLGGDESKVNILLSTSMQSMEEDETVIDDAQYKLVKRSGFVHSENYAATPQKKKNMYFFKSGSVFRSVYDGTVFDVSQQGGHPVYRYGKAMFLGVNV